MHDIGTPQILHVLVHVLRLGCFETARMIFEAWVIHDVPERFPANLSLADVFMTIHARAEIGFGIVQVKREDLLQSNQVIDFLDGGVPTLLRANVVTGGKEMCRIQANAQTPGLSDFVEDGSQM